MSTLELLEAVRAKIADREHWTQHTDARDAEGAEVSILSPKVCCWCVTGALECVAYQHFLVTSDAQRAYRTAVMALVKSIPDEVTSRVDRNMPENEDELRYALHVNDYMEFDGPDAHANVLAMFDRAIEIERAKA